MSFELKTRIDEEEKEYEIIEESITTEHTTKKIWSKEQLQDEIITLTAQIEDIQERRTVLEEQLGRFKK